MQPKPELYSSHYGEWFQDPLVVAEVPTVEGRLQLNTTAHVCWGRPRR